MSGLDGLRKEAEEKITNAKRKEALGRIADMLERKGIDPSEIGRVKRISLYQSLTKGDDGEAEVHDLAAIQFSPSWEDGPQWPVIAQGPAVRIPPVKASKRKDREWKRAVILPDIQAGYFRLHDETLEAIHDERAIETALAVLKDADPDLVVLHGDNLDLAEMGKYMVTPAYARTTQAAIDYMTLLCARLRHLAPHARIVWIAGNHEERLPKYIINNAVASFGLRRGGEPESWPVLSVPHLQARRVRGRVPPRLPDGIVLDQQPHQGHPRRQGRLGRLHRPQVPRHREDQCPLRAHPPEGVGGTHEGRPRRAEDHPRRVSRVPRPGGRGSAVHEGGHGPRRETAPAHRGLAAGNGGRRLPGRRGGLPPRADPHQGRERKVARQGLLRAVNPPASVQVLVAITAATALVWAWRANNRIDRIERAARRKERELIDEEISAIEDYANDPDDDGWWV